MVRHGLAGHGVSYALTLALATVLVLQVMVVHWARAQAVFDTVALSLNDWGLAITVATSVLSLNEGRRPCRSVSRFL